MTREKRPRIAYSLEDVHTISVMTLAALLDASNMLDMEEHGNEITTATQASLFAEVDSYGMSEDEMIRLIPIQESFQNLMRVVDHLYDLVHKHFKCDELPGLLRPSLKPAHHKSGDDLPNELKNLILAIRQGAKERVREREEAASKDDSENKPN